MTLSPSATNSTISPSQRISALSLATIVGVPVRTVIDRGPKGKQGRCVRPRLAGVESGRQDGGGSPRDARVVSGALSAGRCPRRDGARIRRAGPLEIVEDKVGTPSADFWAISFSPSSTESDPMDEAQAGARNHAAACLPGRSSTPWRHVSRLRCAKGPRGGGRERDEIIRHVIRVESLDFAEQVGLQMPEGPSSLGKSPPVSRGLRRGDARVQRRRGRATNALMDAPIPHQTLGLPYARPRVGDGDKDLSWRVRVRAS